VTATYHAASAARSWIRIVVGFTAAVAVATGVTGSTARPTQLQFLGMATIFGYTKFDK